MKYKYLIALLILLIIVGVIFAIRTKPAHAPTDLGMIRVASPKPGDRISSPLEISGQALGPWYFEASFPVSLTDGDGLIIAQGVAQAESNWMTAEFVPFKAKIEFVVPANADAFGRRGTLILRNDNPSGDPAREKTFEIPVIFK